MESRCERKINFGFNSLSNYCVFVYPRSLAVGSSEGYRLFSLGSDDALEEIYSSKKGEDTYLVERLFSSSLVAVVTLSAPRWVSPLYLI